MTPKIKEALIAVRDILPMVKHTTAYAHSYALDNLEFHPTASQFSMHKYHGTNSCGTVRCIGGWMEAYLKDPNFVCSRESIDLAELFMPDLDFWDQITPEDAVQAIQNQLDFGKPLWKEVRPDLVVSEDEADDGEEED